MEGLLRKLVVGGFRVSALGFGIHTLAAMCVNLKAPPKPIVNEPIFWIALITLLVMYLGAASAAIGLIGLVSQGLAKEGNRLVWFACGAFAGPTYLTAVYAFLGLTEGLPDL